MEWGNALNAIKQLRSQFGFSQEYIAEKIGISQGSYAKIESGQTKLGIERLEKIAACFAMTTKELLDYAGYSEGQSKLNDRIKELELDNQNLKLEVEKLYNENLRLNHWLKDKEHLIELLKNQVANLKSKELE